MRNKTILIKCTKLLYKINVKQNNFFGYRILASIYIQQYKINANTDSLSKSYFAILKFWLIKNAFLNNCYYPNNLFWKIYFFRIGFITMKGQMEHVIQQKSNIHVTFLEKGNM